MQGHTLQPLLQQVAQASLPTKIAAIALLALGGALANLIKENGQERLGVAGSIFLAAIPIIAAIFVIALMFKIPWQLGLTLAVTLVVASFSFEEFPRLLRPSLGPGFVSNLVGGFAAVVLAAGCAFILGKILGVQSKRT